MLEQLLKNFDPSMILLIAGVFIFGHWLLETSLGRDSLADSAPRRNSMPMYFPLTVMVVWLFGLIGVIYIAGKLIIDPPDYQQAIIDNVIQGFTSIVLVVVILFCVKNYFARGLKGFGFSFKNIHKDIFYGFGTLIAIWPVVLAIFTLTINILVLIYGEDYQVPVHQELKSIKEYSQVSVYVLIFINGALITPVFEEVLFRGLFQTAIRSYVVRPWPAIVLSSIIFALAHADSAHWPALFILGAAMGYAYEKSNSLLRPIFIHAFFNGFMIIVAIFSSPQS
jgi:membrane protease YdiL (CAAX protease family)